jgi:hypothetical protein
MTTSRGPIRAFNSGRRWAAIIECGLALSVIIGLGFVSFRVLNKGLQMTWTQGPDSHANMERLEATSAARDVSGASAP